MGETPVLPHYFEEMGNDESAVSRLTKRDRCATSPACMRSSSSTARERGNLIAILQDIQTEFRYLPQEVLTYVATAMNLLARRRGRRRDFLRAVLHGAQGQAHRPRLRRHRLPRARRRRTQDLAARAPRPSRPEKCTTEDMQFTLETVACVGACALAPAVVIDDVVYGQQTPESLASLLEEISKQGV